MVWAMPDVDTSSHYAGHSCGRKLTMVLEQLTKPIPLTASELKNVEASGLPPRMHRATAVMSA